VSGPYHERAICECGWSAPCTFGDLFHLSWHGRFVNVCPECGRPKSGMKVRVLRWHERTWRDRDGVPYDGKEPGPASATPLAECWWFPLAIIFAIIGSVIALCVLVTG
jgi:hypothetical protein